MPITVTSHQRLLDLSSEFFVITNDTDAQIQYSNSAWTQRFNLAAMINQAIIGFLDNTHPDDRQTIQALFDQVRLDRDAATFTLEGRWLDSHERYCPLVWHAQHDAPSQLIYWTARDVGEQRKQERRLTRLLHYDPLTGLANRSLLYQHLSKSLADAEGTSLVVAVIDMDNFRMVNEGLGHAAGDQLLKWVAQRLQSLTKAGDMVARLGGDEFVMVVRLEGPMAIATAKLAESINRDLSLPFHGAEQTLHLSASIGMSLYPEHGDTAEALLRYAEMAAYQAKSAGKACVRIYELPTQDESESRLRLHSMLRAAVTKQKLVLYYQPVVNAQTDRIEVVEALLRWNDPELGQIGPQQFIPIAEEIGIIDELGEWVLREACRQAREWERSGLCPQVAVNISFRQFHRQDLSKQVQRALISSGISPEHLELEFTESAVLPDNETTLQTLQELRAMGLTLTLDDFGTGYSSLSHLLHLPVHKIKMDRSFVSHCDSDAKQAAVIAAVTTLGKRMGLTVVAEGVETQAQQQFLRNQGCQLMQGLLFSPPLSATDITELLRRQNTTSST